MSKHKDPDVTMKCLTTLTQGKWQGQKAIKVAYTPILTAPFSALHPSSWAFASEYDGIISLSICLVIVQCVFIVIVSRTSPLLPFPISHLLLCLCSAISQHGRLSPCHSISPERERFLLCTLSAQCTHIPALSTVHTHNKPWVPAPGGLAFPNLWEGYDAI